MMQCDNNKMTQSRFGFWLIIPLMMCPLLAVYSKNILVYLPLITLFFSIALYKTYWLDILRAVKGSNKVMWTGILIVLLYLIAHTMFISEASLATERLQKLLLVIPISGAYLSLSQCIKLSKCSTQKMLYTIMGLSALGAGTIIFDFHTNLSLYRFLHDVPSTSSLSKSTLNTGAISVILMGYSAFLLQDNKRAWSWGLPVILIFMALCCTESQSSQIMAFMIPAAYLFIKYMGRYKWTYWLTAGLLIAVVISKPFIVPWAYNATGEEMNNYSFIANSYVGHTISIWAYVSHKIQESPLLGHGLEIIKSQAGLFETPMKHGFDGDVIHPHSYILQVWVELGVIGIGIFLYTALNILKTIKNIKYNIPVKWSAFAVFVTLGFVRGFSFGLWQGWWIALIVMISALHIVVYQSNKHIDTPQ